MFARIAYGTTAALTVAVVVAELLHAPTLLIFAATALALIGLAWVLGQASESLGHHSGPRIGGILNATFGNAANSSCHLRPLCRAHNRGEGFDHRFDHRQRTAGTRGEPAFGGLKNGIQHFSAEIAGINASMLAIVAAALSLPTIFAVTSPGPSPTTLSIEVAIVMFVLYVLYLLYILRSPAGGTQGEGEAPFGRTASLVLLFAATAAVACVSEAFVGAIEPLTEEYGISELFVGVILVPIVGNIAEHVVGVQIAYKNDMDFSMGISLGSSIQVALLVTPILVFLGPCSAIPCTDLHPPGTRRPRGRRGRDGLRRPRRQIQLAGRRDALRRLHYRRPRVLLLAVRRYQVMGFMHSSLLRFSMLSRNRLSCPPSVAGERRGGLRRRTSSF